MERTDPEWTTGSGETPIDGSGMATEASFEAWIAPEETAPDRPPQAPFEVEWTAATDPGPVRAALADRWELMDTLGRGASAEVRVARDRRSGERVAMKLLRPEHGISELAQRRLFRELDSLMRLKHPNVVELRGYGMMPTGEPLLALELIEGVNLETAIANGVRYDAAGVRALALALAQGLAAIHSAGVVHRDFKPANVMVLRDGGIKIVDFGISRLLDLEQTRLTAAGAFLGSPATVAPEQIDDSHAAGPPADMYALGATLYWLLTGRAPYRGSLPEVLEQHRRAPVPELPDHGGLGPLVRRLLQKNPAVRPTAAEVVRLLGGRPAKDPSTVAFGLLLLLVVVGGALLTLRFAGGRKAPVAPLPAATGPSVVERPRAVTPSPASAGGLRASLSKELGPLGLTFEDLSWIAPEELIRYEAALGRSDPEGAQAAAARAMAQAQNLRLDDSSLHSAVDRVMEQLHRPNRSAEAQRNLEERYQALRRRLSGPHDSRAERLAILREAHALRWVAGK